VLADDSSPAFMVGGFECLMSMFFDLDKVQKAFRDGTGLSWHEHHPSLFSGTERFFRAGYNANLEPSWIPALDGMSERLQAGARVADVGGGFGASTIVMAQAYPASTFVGYDYHEPSILAARERAAEAGVGDRVRFEVAGAQNYPGRDFHLVTFFDCLHDMGDPVGAARHVRETLSPDGMWMIVEPFANDRLEDNLNPVGRVYLFRLDDDLYALLAVTGSRTRAWCPSLREAHSQCCPRRGIRPLSARRTTALQHRLRSPTLAT
jgi:SAM-dependent methyltransferase